MVRMSFDIDGSGSSLKEEEEVTTDELFHQSNRLTTDLYDATMRVRMANLEAKTSSTRETDRQT
jgi:chemotaxis protein histidine kinase CheA